MPPPEKSQRRDFTLTIAESPPSMNAKGAGYKAHHMVAHREKKRWEQRYRQELIAMRVPRGMVYCEVEVAIRWKERPPAKNERDETNYYSPVIKPFADTLSPPKKVLVKTPFGRKMMDNDAPRWLDDDSGDFFKVKGFEFEYPKEWPYLHPAIKSEMVIVLHAYYPALLAA